jgi:hypothetical protein
VNEDQPDVLTPDVMVWVHPINTEAHPTYTPGYRWAVHVGGHGAAMLQYCCNAGRADTQTEAKIIGESHGAAVCKGLRLLGIPARYGLFTIGWDPIPAEADNKQQKIWTGE